MDLEEAKSVAVANASVADDQLHSWEREGYESPRDLIDSYAENMDDTLYELGLRMYESNEDLRISWAASAAFWAHLVELGTIKYTDEREEDWVITKPGLDGLGAAPTEGYYLNKATQRDNHSIFYGPMGEDEARTAVALLHDPHEPTGEQLHAWYNLHGFPRGLSVDYLTPGEITYLLEGYEMSGEFRSYLRMRGRVHPGWASFTDDPVAFIHRNYQQD
jgi:hypothetical protein